MKAEVAENIDTWQSKCGEVRVRLSALLERGLWTDCELAVGTEAERVPAHRVLLASASPVLASMIYGPMPTPPYQPLLLPDIEPEIAHLLLKYIYTDNIVLSSCDVACSLYRAAHYLLMSHPAAVCKAYLVDNVSAEYALRIYEFAQLYGEDELVQKCMKVMQEQASTVLQLVGKSSESPRIGTLVKLFSLPDLNIKSEMELLQAADRYGQLTQAGNKGQQPSTSSQLVEDTQNKAADSPIQTVDVRLLLRPLLQQIRFLAMDPEEFAKYDMSHLLSQSELLAISFNLLSNKSHLAMPTGFTTSMKPRKIKNVLKMKVPYLPSSRIEGTKSDTFYIEGLPWRIDIMENSIDVDCNWDARSGYWYCKAIISVKAQHPNQTCKVLKTAKCELGTSSNREYFHQFTNEELSWTTLGSSSNGFVVDGAITIEVHVDVIDVQPAIL
ncbi:hypothetical protein O0L34_g214 [Tuta absoluta]|nr:hypothetical protein O0L34_g214 [Tuta absoluta]